MAKIEKKGKIRKKKLYNLYVCLIIMLINALNPCHERERERERERGRERVRGIQIKCLQSKMYFVPSLVEIGKEVLVK